MKTTKKVLFKKLTISNFKGIKSLEVDFSDSMTIAGANATGKTTIFDSILWVLFGKNSQDAKDFSIKNTVDPSLNRADHVVELEMTVDGLKTVAKRVYKEKWTKRRGSEETEFTGNESEFFWNSSPLNAREYSAKIGEIIPEGLFKLLTDPLFFNTDKKTAWTERRDVLVGMAGNVTDEKVINGTAAFQELFARLQGQKTLVEYAKQIAFEKTGLRKQLADIPARIDELIKSNPEKQDWTAIEKEIAEKTEAIKKIDVEIESINFAFEQQMKEVRLQQNAAIQASRKMGEIENDLNKKAMADASEANKGIFEAKYQLGNIRSELKTKLAEKENLEVSWSRLTNQVAKLRTDWGIENAKELVFDESKFTCPTCKRAFEADDVDMQKADMNLCFRTEKDQNLTTISASGKAKAQELKAVELIQSDIDAEIASLQAKEKSFEWSLTAVEAQPKPVAPQLEVHAEYQKLKAESERAFNIIQPEVSEQKEMKQAIQSGIDELKELLATKSQIERNAIRIEQLKADEKKYAKDLADLEKTEFTIANFQKTKMNMIENSINGRFKIVKFKLFETQINGGETPCCETMVNGVPFSDLNHAMQINAGIDCINALSEHYGVSAPLVVDNSEAVNELLPTDSQLIKLAVTLDKSLVITNN